MSELTPFHVFVGAITIVVLIIIGLGLVFLRGVDEDEIEESEKAVEVISPAGYLRGIRNTFAGTSYTYDYCENCDEDCEPDCDCECHIGQLPDAPFNLEKAVEVNGPAEFGPATFEIADMTLRLTKPHLFAANWYAEARKDFSRWAADQWFLIDQHQREMGIGAYAS